MDLSWNKFIYIYIVLCIFGSKQKNDKDQQGITLSKKQKIQKKENLKIQTTRKT